MKDVGIDIGEEEFLDALKHGPKDAKYPTELTMKVSFGCPHCEGLEEHTFLGFRTNRDENGKYLEEAWKCNCCNEIDYIRRRK